MNFDIINNIFIYISFYLLPLLFLFKIDLIYLILKNIILIVLLIPIFIAIIIFNIKFIAKFYFHDFMRTLEQKIYERKDETNTYGIIDSFEEIFCRYSDSSGLMHGIYITISLGILIIAL